MKGFFNEFKKFALRGNAIDLAVGIVIGAAFNSIVNAFVADVVAPPLSLLTGGIRFGDLQLAIPTTNAIIKYGDFLQAVVSFLITAFALFLLVRGINRLTHLARSEQSNNTTPPEQKSPELVVLEEIRDSIRK